MNIKQIEARLRLKIKQARLNGFTVRPMHEIDYSGASFETQECCLGWAANDLICYPGSGFWLTDKQRSEIVNAFEDCSSIGKNRTQYHKLGTKLRKECLDYIAKHS